MNSDERPRRGLLALLLLLLAAGVAVIAFVLASGDGKGADFKKEYRQTDAAVQQLDDHVLRAVRPAQSNADAVRQAEIDALVSQAASLERRLRALNPPAKSATGVERLRTEVSELSTLLDDLLRAIRAHNVALITSTSRTLVVRVPAVSQQSKAVAGSGLAPVQRPAAPSPRGTRHLHLGQTAILHARQSTASGIQTWAIEVTVLRGQPLPGGDPATGEHLFGVYVRVRNVGSRPYSGLGEDNQKLITSAGKESSYSAGFTGPPQECSVNQSPTENIKVAPGQTVQGCNPYSLVRSETAKAVRWKLFYGGTDAAEWAL